MVCAFSLRRKRPPKWERIELTVRIYSFQHRRPAKRESQNGSGSHLLSTWVGINRETSNTKEVWCLFYSPELSTLPAWARVDSLAPTTLESAHQGLQFFKRALGAAREEENAMSTSITILHGNLGKDPEIFRVEGSGFPIATFSLATTRRVSDGNNGTKEVTDWHNIKALGKNAELAEQYLRKGKEIIVTGHNETRDYDKDGQKHYMTEVVVERFDFCGSANGGSTQSQGGQQSRGNQGNNRNQSGQQSRGNWNQNNQHSRGNQSGGNWKQSGYQQQHGDEVPYDQR